MSKSAKRKTKSSDTPVNKLAGKSVMIAAMVFVAAASFAAGIVSSDSLKNGFKKQEPVTSVNPQSAVVNSGYPGNVQTPGPATNSPVSTNPGMQPADQTLSPEHQQHVTDAAKRISEAAKTGDYSFLLGAVDAKEEIYKIDIAEAKYLFDSGKAIFVDARAVSEYEQGHIKGAVSVPTTATPEDIAKLKSKLAGKVLVTYCHGTNCHLADKTALKLYEAGYRKIAIFWGGWPKWNEYKYPVKLKQ